MIDHKMTSRQQKDLEELKHYSNRDYIPNDLTEKQADAWIKYLENPENYSWINDIIGYETQPFGRSIDAKKAVVKWFTKLPLFRVVDDQVILSKDGKTETYLIEIRAKITKSKRRANDCRIMTDGELYDYVTKYSARLKEERN